MKATVKDKAFDYLAESPVPSEDSKDLLEGKMEELENKIAERLDQKIEESLNKWEEKLKEMGARIEENLPEEEAPENEEIDNETEESEE
jgi:hypothetical protein